MPAFPKCYYRVMNNLRPATVLAPKIVESAPLIYTRAEVAEMLGVSVDTVRRWTRDRRLVPTRLTERVVRISRAELERFIRDRTR